MADDSSKVLKALKAAGKPVRPGEVADLTGLPKDAVSKIISGLKKEGLVESPKRCFWALVEDK